MEEDIDIEIKEMKQYISGLTQKLDTMFSSTDEPVVSLRRFVGLIIQENMDLRCEHTRMLTHVEETDKRHYDQRLVLKNILSLCVKKVNRGEKFNQEEATKINKVLEKL